jgi:hypothetical protein
VWDKLRVMGRRNVIWRVEGVFFHRFGIDYTSDSFIISRQDLYNLRDRRMAFSLRLSAESFTRNRLMR